MSQAVAHETYMKEAFNEALRGMESMNGGPFGAVIVMNGEIVGKGHNQVTSTNDPTAHAEVMAIREACSALKTFQLSGATLYATCEPCPMCLSAIYWADIKTVYFAADRYDAARIGFSDKFIYDELEKPIELRHIGMKRLPMPETNALFDRWNVKTDKIPY